MSGRIANALTFDIEDWFHLLEVASVADADRWATLPTLVERYTHQILERVQARGVRATFFVVGWVAERYPNLVKDIADAGHEIASHSFWHRRVTSMQRAGFREDLKRSVSALEQLIAQRIRGYRAPGFSIDDRSSWALDELLDVGIEYDASIVPRALPNGDVGRDSGPHRRRAPSGRSIAELPVTLLDWGPLPMGFCGGGYMRLWPAWVCRLALQRLNRRGLPGVLYLHPRDLAPDCPRTPMPLHRQFKCRVGLRSTSRKLDALLSVFWFDTCAAILGLGPALVKQQLRATLTPPRRLGRLPVLAVVEQQAVTQQPRPW